LGQGLWLQALLLAPAHFSQFKPWTLTVSQQMAVSGVNVRIHMTFVIVFVVLCTLLVSKLTSGQASLYSEMKSDGGHVLCATSPPNKTLDAVGKRLDCLALCSRGCQSPCQAFNYRQTTQLCELFHYEPCSYDQEPDCINYQVVNSTRLVIFIFVFTTVNSNQTPADNRSDDNAPADRPTVIVDNELLHCTFQKFRNFVCYNFSK